MRPLGVVEPDPLADDVLDGEAVGQFVGIDRLVLQRPPRALNEDVVHAPAASVHGDGYPCVLDHPGWTVAKVRPSRMDMDNARRRIEDRGPGVRKVGDC